MTKAQALFSFWSGFVLPAYEENAVPTGKDAPDFPYLTYEAVFDSISADTPMSASLWFRSTSWLEAQSKAEEISKAIGRGGKIIPCDGGAIWIKRGSPFAQFMGDEIDDLIRRVYINITAEYLTAD